ncbi:MAG: HD domain-containing phosphohydrolase [Granulosicoccaceae bacterium]|jgi:HD-GYP domain-containing protein (c-di-GMP phosphodiesterase class II)
MPVKQIPSNEIEVGMYVASLDRPWSETPFLFQGFEVHSQQEIDELQRLTRHVHIMVPDEEIVLKRLPDDHEGSLQSLNMLHRIKYNTTVAAQDEVVAVRESHETISQLITEIESLVQAESKLRLDDIEKPVKIMVNSVLKNPDAYLWLTRIRKFDSFIYKDSLSAAVWATALGRRMGMTEQDLCTLATGCMLMDVGKLALPTELLQKHSRLDHDDWELMKTHVGHGLSILEADPHCTTDIMDIVRTHHERLNGSGYPAGLHGSQIPLFGQIAGIVDFYVAVTTPRPFARVISPSQAEQMLYDQKDNFFDEILVEYFIQTLSPYPTGSLVELSTDEVAIVMAQNPGLRLRPNVVLLLDPDKKTYGANTLVNLADYKKDNIPVTIVKTLRDGSYGLQIEELSL